MTIAAVNFAVTLVLDPHGERIVIFAFLNVAVLLWNTVTSHVITNETFVTRTSLVTRTIVSVTPATTTFGFIAVVHAIAEVLTVRAPWTIETVVFGDTVPGGVITGVTGDTFASSFTGFGTVQVLAVTLVVGVTAVSFSTSIATRVPLFIFTTSWSAHFINGDTVTVVDAVAPYEPLVALTSGLAVGRWGIDFTISIPIAAILVVASVTALVPEGVFTTLNGYWHHTTCFFVSHTSLSGICWNHSGWTFALWNTFTSAIHLTTAITSSIRAAVKV